MRIVTTRGARRYRIQTGQTERNEFVDRACPGCGDGAITYYVDVERIRKHGGYVYYWDLADFSGPIGEDLSMTTYNKVNCNILRYLSLSINFYKEPMGRGIAQTTNYGKTDWTYPPPNSGVESHLKLVCTIANRGL